MPVDRRLDIFRSYPSVAKMVVQDYLQRTSAKEQEQALDGLTERERKVLTLIAEGLTNQEIAGRLFISIKTVQTHRAHIMEKLNLHDRTELVRYAIRKGLIEPWAASGLRAVVTRRPSGELQEDCDDGDQQEAEPPQRAAPHSTAHHPGPHPLAHHRSHHAGTHREHAEGR